MDKMSAQGKYGNKKDTWFFHFANLNEFKIQMNISEDKYKKTNDLLRRVVDEPLRELNEAGFGFTVRLAIKKNWRSTDEMWFICEYGYIDSGSARTSKRSKYIERLDNPESLVKLQANKIKKSMIAQEVFNLYEYQ
jgi:hypothetical protein